MKKTIKKTYDVGHPLRDSGQNTVHTKTNLIKQYKKRQGQRRSTPKGESQPDTPTQLKIKTKALDKSD